MDPRRLRAPKDDGALLCEPPWESLPALARANAQSLERPSIEIQGRRLDSLRRLAREELLEASRSFHHALGLDSPAPPATGLPWLMTGHQPELSHPGVWAKTVAAGNLARRAEVVAVNLIVDDDVPKSPGIRVPCGDPPNLRAEFVPFASTSGDAPYESWRIDNSALFEQFGPSISHHLRPIHNDPIIAEFWPSVLARREASDRIGWLFAAARHALDHTRFGARLLDVPQSALCETESFAWFLAHILANLSQFQRVHNRALDQYRAANRIRSTQHPVPSLERENHEWLEAPFWVWRDGAPRRQSLWARLRGCTMELRLAREAEPFLDLPLCPGRDATEAVDRLRELPGRGIRLRTRALTTTLFARWYLGDLFVHGIGGAKYDELGDEIARAFYAAPPPAFATLSLTAWLGLPVDPTIPEQLHELDRKLRETRFHAEFFLPAERIHDLVVAKKEAIAAPVATRRDRRERWRRLRDTNEALARHAEPIRLALAARRDRLSQSLAPAELARSRDWSFVLHGEARIRNAFAPFLRASPAAIVHPGEMPKA
jgi:hypothetical protein